jgi:hypothetical protein
LHSRNASDTTTARPFNNNSLLYAPAYPCHLQVLDAEDADMLLQLLALQQQFWDPNQLAAALVAGLPCLGETAPSGGDALAVLFAAVGAAAGGMGGPQAGQLLVVLAQLPGFAPDPTVGC